MTDSASLIPGAEGLEARPPSTPEADIVEAMLTSFEGIAHPTLRTIVAAFPLVILALLLVDWLFQINLFVRDILRWPTYLAVALEAVILRMILNKVPKVLGTIWRRGLLKVEDRSVGKLFAQYLQSFEDTLNHRASWVMAGLVAVVPIFASYPVQQFLATQNPAELAGLGKPYTFLAAIVQVAMAFVVGTLLWRFFFAAIYFTRLSATFELQVIPNHPDRSGGLKPLGDLCFNLALVLLVPAFLIAVWLVAMTQPGLEILQLWQRFLSGLLILLCLGGIFLFLRPLWKIHRSMEAQRDVIRRELDRLSNRMGLSPLTAISQGDTMGSDKGQGQFDSVDLIKRVYDEYWNVPTWPFDWNVLVKFATAEALPLLSLTGLGGPIFDLLDGVVPLLHR